MRFLTECNLQDFLNERNYDIRASGNARWIDQKCTPDVVTIVADCVIQYISKNTVKPFSSSHIWHDDYAVKNVEDLFKKPSPSELKARSEYNKFFQQPMEMMAYAGILRKERTKSLLNFYSVNNFDVLEHLSYREQNSLDFLCLYIEKVLRDSGIYYVFDDFFRLQTKNAYETVKDAFTTFTIKNTRINNTTECNRIFTKIINPLAYKLNSRGTERGRISKHRITRDMLMYNRDNFWDLGTVRK